MTFFCSLWFAVNDASVMYLRLQLVLGAIVLVEFVVLSFLYYYAFGYSVITASTASHKTPSAENLEGGGGPGISLLSGGGESSGKNTPAKFSFPTFLADVGRLHDVVGVLTYRSELYTPLGDDSEP